MTPIGQGGRYHRDRGPLAAAESGFGLTSASRTVTGTGPEFSSEDAVALEAILDVSVVSGTTPTLDVRLETSVDGVNWDTVAAFPQQTAVGQRGRTFGPVGQKCRWAWTIAGTTPDFTFSVSAAVQRGK